jgi:hypothetical protein
MKKGIGKSVMILAQLGLVGLAGCEGRGTDEAAQFAPQSSGGGTVTFARVHEAILAPRCVRCHSEFDREDLLLASGDVVPGDPGNSALYQMVDSGQMPQGESRLSDGQIDLIRQYIVSLAPAARGGPHGPSSMIRTAFAAMPSTLTRTCASLGADGASEDGRSTLIWSSPGQVGCLPE